MDLTLLEHFHHSARAKSFVEGARMSHVSPPAISKSIKKLESELGVALFRRTTRRVSLTPAGEVLLERTANLFRAIDDLRRDVHQAEARIGGDLRIGAMEIFSIYLLPVALSRVVKQYPSLIPRCYEMIPERMERLLLDDRLDVAFTIGSGHGGANPKIRYDSIASSPGRLVCGKTHPLFPKRRLRAGDLLQYPSVAPKFFELDHLPSLDQFPERTHPRRVGATIELFQMAVQLVIEGSFLGYFPEASIRNHLREGRLRVLAGAPERRFEFRVLTRKDGVLRSSVPPLVAELKRTLETASATTT